LDCSATEEEEEEEEAYFIGDQSLIKVTFVLLI
jgi:hypothetical protein